MCSESCGVHEHVATLCLNVSAFPSYPLLRRGKRVHWQVLMRKDGKEEEEVP